MEEPHGKKIICCFKDTYAWLAGGFVGLILFIARIANYFIRNWYYQGSDLKKWKGGLFKVYGSGGYIKEKSYPLLSEYYCAEKSTFSTGNSTFISYNDADGLCLNFGKLTGGITAFFFFSILGLIFWTILLTLLIFNKRQKNRIKCCLVLTVFQFVCEFACLIAVAGSVSITLQGDCRYLSKTDTTVATNVCGSDGCVMSIIISVATFVYHIWMITNYCVFLNCSKPYVDNAPAQNIVEISIRRNPDAPREEEKLENDKKIVDYPD